MSNNTPIFVSAAVGAGVVIGALGVFLYETFFVNRRRTVLQQEVVALNSSLSEMRAELQNLRRAQNDLLRRRRNQSSASTRAADSMSRADTDFASAVDDLDEEFFDLSDNDDTLVSFEGNSTISEEHEEIDKMLDGSQQDKLKAYGILLDLHDRNHNDPEVLWRLAQACHVMVGVSEEIGEDLGKKESYLTKGIEYASKCLEIAPRSSNAHKWYAICVGSQCRTKTASERIKGGLQFKKHILEALEISPNDASLYHLLGRFQFEVATLSWMEKKIAATIYGSIPQATMDEAIVSLKRTEELSHIPWKENRLLLTKAYLFIGDNYQSLQWLMKADEIISTSPEDHAADVEIKLLKEKFKSLGFS